MKNINELGKEKIISEIIMNENNINFELPEMLQRIYIEILLNIIIDCQKKEEKEKILKLIIKFIEENLYISEINIIKLRNFFSLENKDNKLLLPIISKLNYNLVNKGLETEKKILMIIGNTIHLLYTNKKYKKLEITSQEYDETMKYLFLSLEKLIKEKEYNLSDVANKIYEKVLESEKKNEYLVKILINGYYYFDKKNLEFSSKSIDLLIDILIEKEKNEKLLMVIFKQFENHKKKYEKLIPKFFKLIFKYQNHEEFIIKTINSMIIPDEILKNKDFLKYIDAYISKDIHSDLIISTIKRIYISDRTEKMFEKLLKYDNEKSLKDKQKQNNIFALKPEINKRDLILKEYNNLVECGINLDSSQLKEIEKNINLEGFIEFLTLILKRQKELIDKVDLNIISKFFCIKNYALFQIISEEKRIWDEKSLSIIIKGLTRNEENEKKIIIDFLEKIEKYQRLPKFIKDNLNIEKKMQKIENFDLNKDELIALLDEFKRIKDISKNHLFLLNKNITNYFNSSNEEEEKILTTKIIELLLSSGFNISLKNIDFCINHITQDEFINNFSEIISNRRIKPSIKKYIFNKILKMIKNADENEKLKIIKEIKYCCDWENLPHYMIKFLMNLIEINPNENISQLSKEILFILGNIFSNVEEKNIPKEFLEIINKSEIYNLISNNYSNIKLNYKIYILSTILYSEKNITNPKEYYEFPRNFLIDKIKEKINNNYENGVFDNSFKVYEIFHGYNILSPIRDKYIRKLLYNKKFNINKISKVLIQNCEDENKVLKVEGETVNGKLFGYGTMYYTNGDYYVGYFLNNIKEGEGILYNKEFPNGINQIWKDGNFIKQMIN